MPLATVVMATSPHPDLFSDCVKPLLMWLSETTTWQPLLVEESSMAGDGVAMVNWG